ncbi:hypothetical protein HHS34_010550 [Acidithiobacillus montserratensis]|uniref:Uncharacterized protein n=1 Tax=Acidithiobacillus montserratensis TaxID=2729135 RepID=A0ACD5HDE9_9PROT|nr:hypothetical protein [Acidithiobacillus montserratensis]MBN2678812.1 hypothetical protein [Acidithiobacillaceae bacterium]MBU2748833.1 hypothetical protein [Acidithiobacillus montserratensis]
MSSATDPVTIQCVYGSSHIRHIEECLIPALSRSTKRPIRFITINYNPSSPDRVKSGLRFGLEIVDLKNESPSVTGFAHNHNLMFKYGNPLDNFVIINPDCIPHINSIDVLIKRMEKTDGRVAIVEGRQWPFEHPKEYDPLTLHTPWASGAFSLIDAEFYRSIGGMDDIYFLYMEDVDLSWQAWLNGYSVIYEPEASITHFTGWRFYRDDILYPEQYFSLRNFIIISKKFFGECGEKEAIRRLMNLQDNELAKMAIHEYEIFFKQRVTKKYESKRHDNVKILGLGIFHILREN